MRKTMLLAGLAVCGLSACGAKKSGSVTPTATPNCTSGAAGSILATCDAQSRVCVVSGSTAKCDACKSGLVEVSGQCQTATCALAGCAAQNRNCDAAPAPHCTTCVAGMLEDPATTQCRLPKKCADVTCPSGSTCLEPAGVTDATCQQGGCGANAIADAQGVCHGCPSTCVGPGSDGPYLAALTGNNHCICHTLAGWFFNSTLGKPVACDADGDGWVKESAKLELESGDPVSVAQARCTLRSINTIRLVDEAGDVLDQAVPGLPLYETDRNDDQTQLTGKLPTYGGRELRAEELNSLTKACASSQADFNDNGLADAAEWHGETPPAEMHEQFKPFVPYLYFVELYRGWYEAPTAGTGPGRYVIAERSRLSSTPPALRVPVAYDATAGTYHETCTRYGDQDYTIEQQTGLPTTGNDFARFSPSPPVPHPAGFPGLNHHSQFKCVVITATHALADPPNKLTIAMLADADKRYQMNACDAGPQPVPPAASLDPVNPSDAPFTCSVRNPATLANGDVGLVAAGYHDYTPGLGHYVRGCINECVELGGDPAPVGCPGFASGRAMCQGDPANFGKLYCGCGYNYAGTSCEIGCPGNRLDPGAGFAELFLDPAFGFAPARTGYWLCATPTNTSYAATTVSALTQDAGDLTHGYVVRGEIAPTHTSTGLLCQSADCATGYTLR